MHKIEYVKFYNGLPYGKEVSFAGFGKYEVGHMSDRLRVFKRWTMVTNEDCRKISKWSYQITSEHFCAGMIKDAQFPGGYGSCHGKGLRHFLPESIVIFFGMHFLNTDSELLKPFER